MQGTVEVTFAATPDGTRVAVVHRDWAPLLDPDVSLADAIGRWVDDPWQRRLARYLMLAGVAFSPDAGWTPRIRVHGARTLMECD
jgi:hypothetical protein